MIEVCLRTGLLDQKLAPGMVTKGELSARGERLKGKRVSPMVDSADDRIGKIRFDLITSWQELGLPSLIMVGHEDFLLARKVLACCRESEEDARKSRGCVHLNNVTWSTRQPEVSECRATSICI